MSHKKVAVLLWLFHTDLWDEFRTQLHPLQDYIHLYLGLDSKAINTQLIIDQANNTFTNIDINYYPNAGGDILPFLNQISKLSNNCSCISRDSTVLVISNSLSANVLLP